MLTTHKKLTGLNARPARSPWLELSSHTLRITKQSGEAGPCI